MNRRQFLATLTAGMLLVPASGLAGTKPAPSTLYFSARASKEGRHYVSGFDELGALRFSSELPGRGHALAVQQQLNHVTAVARRPGTYLIVLDGETGETIHALESREGRHFFGHSLYSADGRWFYTSENDIENRRGVIGVRDVHNSYQQVAEFPSHGIGPHELRLLSDEHTLVVANGGILTLPETGRNKLNLDTMSPSLTYLNTESGELLEQHKLPQSLHQNSIRHFDVNANDQVCFAMQYQGNDGSTPQMVGLHSMGENLQLMNAPDTVLQQMRNYCGSVCSDISSHWFAVSSPKGGLVTFWSAKEGKYVGSVNVTDGCGIAAGVENGEFLLSSGRGGVYRYRIGSGRLETLEQISNVDARWDNHIARRKG
ncbi:DUF1513 domain-containing protein [Pseudomonadota bacterium]